MAITQKQIPGSFATAHKALWFIVESTNVAQPNFKYVFEVYRGATKIATVKRWPYPGTTFGKFDASEIVKSFLNNLSFKGDGLTHDTIVTDYLHTDFTVKYGEEYGTPPTTYLNLANSGTVRAYNYSGAVGGYLGIPSFSSRVNKFMSMRPLETSLTLTENFYLPYFNELAGANNFSINLFTFFSTPPISTTIVSLSDYLTEFNIGVPAINAVYPGLVTDIVDYYTLEAPGGEAFRVNLDANKRYPAYHIVFLNAYGAYESVYFRGKSKKIMSLERKQYGKESERLTATGTTSPFLPSSTNVNIGNAQEHFVRQSYKYTLTTDFLSDAEFNWLSQLVASPSVYVELSGEYVPVRVTGTNYAFLRSFIDKVNPLEIEIELLDNYNSQSA